MNEATRGPWTLTHISGSNFAVQEFSIRGMFGHKPNVYPIFNRNSEAIDGATIYCSPENARLIAAAPDLLAALKMLRDLDDEYGIELGEQKRDQMHDAIAKAEGRTMPSPMGTKE